MNYETSISGTLNTGQNLVNGTFKSFENPCAAAYLFGFNGKENDKEVYGTDGTFQDYGMRVYDPRICRFPSVDPLTAEYPWYTPYQFAGNTPIQAIDLDGLEPAKPPANESENIQNAPLIGSKDNNQLYTWKWENEIWNNKGGSANEYIVTAHKPSMLEKTINFVNRTINFLHKMMPNIYMDSPEGNVVGSDGYLAKPHESFWRDVNIPSWIPEFLGIVTSMPTGSYKRTTSNNNTLGSSPQAGGGASAMPDPKDTTGRKIETSNAIEVKAQANDISKIIHYYYISRWDSINNLPNTSSGYAPNTKHNRNKLKGNSKDNPLLPYQFEQLDHSGNK